MKNETTTEIVEERGTLTSKVSEFIIWMLTIFCIFLPTFLLLFIFPNNIYVHIIANSLLMIIIVAIVYYYIIMKGYTSSICNIDEYEK